VAHTDLNSSQNQLKKRLTGALTEPNGLEFDPPVVLWWDKGANRFINVSAGNENVAVVVGSL
jgi:hypothetical protein